MISAVSVFFFNDTATTEIYTLSLHDALPICAPVFRGGLLWLQSAQAHVTHTPRVCESGVTCAWAEDRKSTRLNSSHDQISYAVFCLKKKKTPAAGYRVLQRPYAVWLHTACFD